MICVSSTLYFCLLPPHPFGQLFLYGLFGFVRLPLLIFCVLSRCPLRQQLTTGSLEPSPCSPQLFRLSIFFQFLVICYHFGPFVRALPLHTYHLFFPEVLSLFTWAATSITPFTLRPAARRDSFLSVGPPDDHRFFLGVTSAPRYFVAAKVIRLPPGKRQIYMPNGLSPVPPRRISLAGLSS